MLTLRMLGSLAPRGKVCLKADEMSDFFVDAAAFRLGLRRERPLFWNLLSAREGYPPPLSFE